jgi:glucosamine kinase
MIIIADSGSTKADWQVVMNGIVVHSVNTMGLNPFYHDEQTVFEVLKEGYAGLFNPEDISEVHFYGAGCSSPERCGIIKNGIKRFFSKADVTVEHDVLAAARSTCGNQPGIACILGTGSNSCSYDGIKITDNLPSLGFMLGDEGSGCYLGKMLIRKLFYRELPPDVLSLFNIKYGLTKENILENIYNKPGANVFLAKFSRFFSENSMHPFLRKMVRQAFVDFYESMVVKYSNYQKDKVHFVGSISFYFRDILEDVSKEYGCKLGKTIKQPIHGLVEYHIANRTSILP